MDLNEYKDFIKRLADSSENRLFLNSDKEHALIVLVELIRSAQQELRIFAGTLCGSLGDDPEYIIAISEFLERGGKLKIILKDYDPKKALASNLFKRLLYYKVGDKDLELHQSDANPHLSEDPEKKTVHFTIADRKAYRLETDVEHYTAQGNFGDEKTASSYAAFFDEIYEESKDKVIDLQELFNNAGK